MRTDGRQGKAKALSKIERQWEHNRKTVPYSSHLIRDLPGHRHRGGQALLGSRLVAAQDVQVGELLAGEEVPGRAEPHGKGTVKKKKKTVEAQ
eukprot:SAG22_NODE_11283_length_492_cov_1.043257_1_plen_92_part_01